jgi:hypothetical protein
MHVITQSKQIKMPVTVAAPSKAWTVFARSDTGIVGSNLAQGMDVWCAHAYILCLCCPVFRWRPCDGLITRPNSPTVCEKMTTEVNKRSGPWMAWKSHWKKRRLRRMCWSAYFKELCLNSPNICLYAFICFLHVSTMLLSVISNIIKFYPISLVTNSCS